MMDDVHTQLQRGHNWHSQADRPPGVEPNNSGDNGYRHNQCHEAGRRVSHVGNRAQLSP
jgi:hypothetical protein